MPPAGSLCRQPERADPGPDARWLYAALKDRWKRALEAAGTSRLGLWLTEHSAAEEEMHRQRALGCQICTATGAPSASQLSV